MSKIPIPMRLFSDFPIAFVGPASQNLHLPKELPFLPGPVAYCTPRARMDAFLSSFPVSYDMLQNDGQEGAGGKIVVGSAIIRESVHMAEYLVSQPPKQIRDLDVHISNIDVLLAREGILLVLVSPHEARGVISAYRKKDQLVLPSGVVHTSDLAEEPAQKDWQQQLAKDGIHAICVARDRRTLFGQN